MSQGQIIVMLKGCHQDMGEASACKHKWHVAIEREGAKNNATLIWWGWFSSLVKKKKEAVNEQFEKTVQMGNMKI